MGVLKTEGKIIVETTPVFQKNLAAYQQRFPIICNEGGSRSSKSYSVIQLLCGIAKSEPNKRISMVSHSLPHIKRGIYRDFKNIMQEIGWWKEDQWRATDFVYTFSNGSYIELFGLEDEGKARGPGRDILFVNEANLISKPLFDQLAMRTTGQIFLDWNPADFNSWVYEVADDPKNKCIHSTYKDNIHNLSKAQVEYIEHYKDLPDDFMWKVYGLGLRGAAKELIYTQWKYYDKEVTGDVFYGLDFGFTNPAALVKVTHSEGANYAEELLYQSGLTNPPLIDLIKDLGISKGPIYADCAEPKTIEELYKAGINVLPSDKDVWAGIVGVKSYPLYVRHGSTNLIRELQGYKWRKNKNDEVLEEPIKANDHACFTGDVLVTTINGDVPIKDIQVGDLVLTSKGYKQVINKFNNGVKYVENYALSIGGNRVYLSCTPNHKIQTNKGWQPISELKSGATIYHNRNLTVKSINYTPGNYITEHLKNVCTLQYGNTIMAKCRKALLSIIKTTTPQTMILAIWSLYQRATIMHCIITKGLKTIPIGLIGSTHPALLQRLNIIEAQKAESLRANRVEKCGAKESQLNILANTAEVNTKALHLKQPTTAIKAAEVKQFTTVGSWSETVYDLEVDEVHEYFANGLLVHNCDALRYAIFTHLTMTKVEFWTA